ncbi:MAG: nucleotidyltransferase domain-containing protein [Deltaproteobacteria bacterium]|nr:nucleotidyltransferase domain-containing protein [Deltaproteobacteria bacterium]
MRAFKKTVISRKERTEVIEDIRASLEKDEASLFAYIYGSFCGEQGFNDIDVAVFADETIIKKETILDYQLGLAVRLERALNRYPVDVRVLNVAPLSFKFSVITNGVAIYSKDEKDRVSFEVMTRSLYFDFKPHARFYYRNMIAGLDG